MPETSRNKILISFVFSFRNEAGNIPELVQRVSAAVSKIPGAALEMIFVNDDSSDKSLDLLIELQRTQPITVLNMSRRFGVIPCILAGLAQSKGDAVVCLDADLQDPPELLEEMVRKFKDGAEVVHTTRTKRHGENAAKMWITKWAYRVINAFSDIELPENTGNFKLLSRKVVEKILSMPEQDPYIRGLSVWVGYRQDFVFYEREARFSGRTQVPLFGKGPALEFVRGLTAFSTAPLYFSLFLGLVVDVFAVALIAYALITKYLGVASPGSSGVLIAMAFFSGSILTTNGLMGLYVARIYQEVQRRPKYIVKEILSPRDPSPSQSATK